MLTPALMISVGMVHLSCLLIMPWYCYLALKQLFPSRGKLSLHAFFYLLSIVGVTLGVFLLVVSQSVMGGFGEMWREKIIKTGGDLNIVSNRLIFDYEPLMKVLADDPDIAAVAPFAEGIGLLQYRGVPALPTVIGLDVEFGPEVIPIRDFLVESTLDALDDEAVFLSTSIAQRMGVTVGDSVEFHTPLMIEKIKQDEILLPRELLVAGLYETGWPDFDRNSIVVTLGLMQEFYALEDGIHRLIIRLEPNREAATVSKRLNKKLPSDLASITWSERASDFLWVLGFERFMVFMLTIPINLVGGFVIVCAQLLTIISKTREIGLLGALGGTRQQLMASYCFQGFMLGGIGSILGSILAILFLHFKDNIVHALAWLTQSQQILESFYAFSTLPVQYTIQNFIIIITSAIFLATLASILPAFIAARKKPADALRME